MDRPETGCCRTDDDHRTWGQMNTSTKKGSRPPFVVALRTDFTYDQEVGALTGFE
jgi:hypothetical protein